MRHLSRLLGTGGAVRSGVGVRHLLVLRSGLHLLAVVHPSRGGPARGMYLHSGLFNLSPAFCSFFVLLTDSVNLSKNLVLRVKKDGTVLLSFSTHIENWMWYIALARKML